MCHGFLESVSLLFEQIGVATFDPMPRRAPNNSSLPVPPAEAERLRKLSIQLATRVAGRDEYLRQHVDDIAAKAFEGLIKQMGTKEIHNPEAFMVWKLRNLRYDYFRRRTSENHRLQMWDEEMTLARGKPQVADASDTKRFWLNQRGLSADIISKEERAMASLQAVAMCQILPDPDDRAILSDRFFAPHLSISDIARTHGGRSPASMANHMKKLLGTQDEPGYVTPVREVVGSLQMGTAKAFCREISSLDDYAMVSDPLGGAIHYLERMSGISRLHDERARMGISRLQWIERNLPSHRGMGNKVLHRLVRAACFYVVEENDARPDRLNDMGLHDDVQVVHAVQEALRRHGK